MSQTDPSPRRARRYRRRFPLTLCVATAAFLTQVPGFDVLDYHACLALAPVMALCAGLLQLRAMDEKLANSAQRGWDRWWPIIAVICLPAAVLLANGFRVPNCSRASGLAIYALGPVASVAVAVAMATVVRALTPRWSRTAFFVLALASCLPAAWHFLSQAQVNAYAPLVGHIAGALYEDVVEVQWCWLSYRLLDLALWSALVAAARAQAGPRRNLALALALTALAVGLQRAPLDGWRVDRDTLLQALPVRVALDIPGIDAPNPGAAAASAPTPALVLHMPAGAELAWLRREVARDVRHDYVRLWRFFGRPAGDTIHVHLYPDVATKHRLMGARQVEMAKPWLAQVHMLLPSPGGSVLRHELAHVFAAPAGRWPLAVPLRGGWLPDALLIEGVAVAAEWPLRGGLDPHRQARAMRALGLAPPLTTLLSPAGFFGQSGARAYTLAGSFVRWLVNSRGPEVLDRLYRDGDVAAAAGEPMQTLVERWAAFIDRDPSNALNERDMAMAQARFEPSALWQRPCLLSIGRCRSRAGRAMIAGNFGRERELRDGLMTTLTPHLAGRALGPDLVLAQAAAQARSGDPATGLQTIQTWLARPSAAGLSKLRRAALLMARGDLRLHVDDLAGAEADWLAVSELPVADHVRRSLQVRRHLLKTDASRRWLRDSMVLGSPPARWRLRVEALLDADPGDPVVAYLHARANMFRYDSGAAEERLAGLLPVLQRRWPLLAQAARRLLALRAARLGQCHRASEWLRADDPAGEESWRAEVEATCAIAAALTS